MKLTAASAVSLAVILLGAGCRTRSARPMPATPAPVDQRAAPSAPPAAGPLAPSPRLLVGRIAAIDAARGFAFVELAPEAPAIALVADTELIVRSLELQETARVRASRYLRGRMLGATVARGQPRIGDEVVWLAP